MKTLDRLCAVGVLMIAVLLFGIIIAFLLLVVANLLKGVGL